VRRSEAGRQVGAVDHAVADVMGQFVSRVVAVGRGGLRLGASMRCVHAGVYWARSSSGWQSPWPLCCLPVVDLVRAICDESYWQYGVDLTKVRRVGLCAR
jgi:hypothetical protein